MSKEEKEIYSTQIGASNQLSVSISLEGVKIPLGSDHGYRTPIDPLIARLYGAALILASEEVIRLRKENREDLKEKKI